MESNWAVENLATIRTLMERSAVYRRALAPVATFAGVVGIVAALLELAFDFRNPGLFAIYWMTVSMVALLGGILLVRRQALRHEEAFWSPPTRRVAMAMLPPMLVGMVFGLVLMRAFWSDGDSGFALALVPAWTLLYGLALHAASFFMPPGVRLFAWAYLFAGLATLTALCFVRRWPSASPILIADFLMGLLFGGAHLLYGIYLYFTEARKNEA